MHYLEKGSSAIIMAGPAIASSDGYTPSTALALTTAPAIRLSKNGAAYGNRGSTIAVASTYAGYYSVSLSSNDTDTLGRLRISIYKSSTHIPFWEDFTVITSNVYDSLYGGSTYLQTDVRTIEGADATTQITAGSTTLKFQAMGSSDKLRVTAECGSSGNRQGMTLDATT
jgi:hypothetical protein